jgi:hypothetical protein
MENNLYYNEVQILNEIFPHFFCKSTSNKYRMSQEIRSIFCEVIVSVILSKNGVYVHVSYSERFPIELVHCRVHCTLHRQAAHHVLTRVAKCIDVNGGILKSVLH